MTRADIWFRKVSLVAVQRLNWDGREWGQGDITTQTGRRGSMVKRWALNLDRLGFSSSSYLSDLGQVSLVLCLGVCICE